MVIAMFHGLAHESCCTEVRIKSSGGIKGEACHNYQRQFTPNHTSPDPITRQEAEDHHQIKPTDRQLSLRSKWYDPPKVHDSQPLYPEGQLLSDHGERFRNHKVALNILHESVTLSGAVLSETERP